MTTADLRNELIQGLNTLGLSLPDEAVDRLLAYQDLIARWNKVYNLTAVRDAADMLRQHLLDSLSIVSSLDRHFAAQAHTSRTTPWRILDVGSGAGLPGVVLSIVRPHWDVTCVDTVAKKASFIRQVAAELGLPHLHGVHQRVEAMTEPAFDLVTSRAFASLHDFISLTRDRLTAQGVWAAMKAHLTEEERQGVPDDVQIASVESLVVPGLDAQRCLVWLHRAA